MANNSIRAAFERLWQHTVAKVGEQSDSALASAKEYTDTQLSNFTPTNITSGTVDLVDGESELTEGAIYLVYEEE